MTRLLLEWVATASLLILAVIALRALLGRRISAGLRYALWAVALVRLLVPLQFFSLPVPAVLPEIDKAPIATSAAPAATAPVHQGEPVGEPAITVPLPSNAVVNYDAIATPSAVTLGVMSPWDVLGWLWLAGSLIMAAAFLVFNLVFALRLRRVRMPLEGADCSLPVYLAESLPSPCLFGLVRPAVYVTAGTAQDPAMLRHILAHEHTHFRHGDHLWNILRSAALAVHWWNPLVWLAVVLSRRDCELACDEGAIKRLGDGERIAYGRTLLALITVKPRPGDLLRCSTTMTGGQKSVFDRVTRIARAPKRWLWAAVAAVTAASLACVCAFGAAEETGDGAEPDFALSIAPLESELNFSIGEDGNVVITGTIDGLTLEAGTYWQSAGAPAHTLMMPYAPFDDDNADGYLQAQWNGDNTVLIWSQIMTTPSNDPNAGFWTFSVDLSREQAVVTDMASLPSSPAKTDSDTKLHLYPESISDEEAVRAARIAAKLMTEAEDYYNNMADLPHLYTALLGGAPFYSVDAEKTLTFDTIAEDLDPYGIGYEITRYASVDFDGDGLQELILYVEQQGAFYFILHEMDGALYSYGVALKEMQNIKTDGTFWDRYVYPPEGDGQGYGYARVSFTNTRLELHPFTYDIYLPSREDGSDSNYRLVVDGQPADSQTFEAAVAAQNAKPDITWHEFPEQTPAPTQPVVPTIDPAPAGLEGVTFSDGWYNSVSIEGVDVQEMYWYSPSTYTPYGMIFFTNPAFLGPAFEGRSVSGNAQWGDDSHTYIRINWSWDHLPYLDFDLDLDTGAVSREATWDGLTEEGLLTAARALAWLMEQAEAYKTSNAYRPVEDGPLPFDRPMELEFASGAGAWQTNLLLHPDGSFVGDYSDADMTIEYVCQFHGRFGDIKQVTDASWSLVLEELVLDTRYPVGTEWDEGVIHYISSNPYGFDKKGGDGPLEPGAQFMLYTPEAEGYRPTDELYGMQESDDYESTMYQFWSWWPDKHVWGPYSGPLGCYGLCNMATGQGFFDLKAWGIA